MLDEPRRILRRAHRNDQTANPWVAALAAPLVVCRGAVAMSKHAMSRNVGKTSFSAPL
jgi:hypothetical protein